MILNGWTIFLRLVIFSYRKATKEFILWLDADDILLKEDQEQFTLLKEELTKDIDGVSMPYILATYEQGIVTHSVIRNRLVRRDRHFKWYGAVHEYLEVGGRILPSNIQVRHLGKKKEGSNRNLSIY